MIELRVLQLHNRYRERGGEDATVALEAAALRRAGIEVHQHLVTNPPGSLASAKGLVRAPWSRRSAADVAELVRVERPDVVHVNNTWYTFTPSILRALGEAGIPTVATLHNYRLLCVNSLLFRDGGPCLDCVGKEPWRGIAHRCYRDSAVASAAVAATISANRRTGVWEIPETLIVPSAFAKRTFVESGMDPDRFTVVPGMVPDPGERPAPPSESRTVLYVGRLSPEKGLDILLRAWAARGAELGLELTIIGEGPLQAEIEASLPAGVSLLGWLEPAELARTMLRARALAFPSLCFETFGRTVAEAFSAGLPVLGAGRGAAGELISAIGRGWAVDSSQPDAWSESLGLLADDQAVDRAGERARRQYLDVLTEQLGVERLLAVYERARMAARCRIGS